MGKSSFSGPVRAGRVKADNQFHFGNAVLSQSATISATEAGTYTATFYVPNNTQIEYFRFDVTTAFDSATSAVLDAGTSSGDDTYISNLDVTTAGRSQGSPSAAQAEAMFDVGTNNEVVVTVTATGATTEGTVLVSLFYVQK